MQAFPSSVNDNNQKYDINSMDICAARMELKGAYIYAFYLLLKNGFITQESSRLVTKSIRKIGEEIYDLIVKIFNEQIVISDKFINNHKSYEENDFLKIKEDNGFLKMKEENITDIAEYDNSCVLTDEEITFEDIKIENTFDEVKEELQDGFNEEDGFNEDKFNEEDKFNKDALNEVALNEVKEENNALLRAQKRNSSNKTNTFNGVETENNWSCRVRKRNSCKNQTVLYGINDECNLDKFENYNKYKDINYKQKKSINSYIPLEIKMEIINMAREHPTWDLHTLQKNGCLKLKSKNYLKVWEKCIETGIPMKDKYAIISLRTLNCFKEAQQNNKPVSHF
ncbi:hypothetical protein M0802_012105 [Mischocyttarus mexicanus]|nr:hypothetical protein M0802_012105 [Mischocyttarus mexicanus]